MGDSSGEVIEESRDASQEEKGQAMEAMSEGKLEEAVEHLTKVILPNPTSAITYGTRASVFIKMKKPAAAIRDANAALEVILSPATFSCITLMPMKGEILVGTMEKTLKPGVFLKSGLTETIFLSS